LQVGSNTQLMNLTDGEFAGGSVAGVARVQLERETGEPVVSSKSFIGKEKRAADPERLTAPKGGKRR